MFCFVKNFAILINIKKLIYFIPRFAILGIKKLAQISTFIYPQKK